MDRANVRKTSGLLIMAFPSTSHCCDSMVTMSRERNCISRSMRSFNVEVLEGLATMIVVLYIIV